MPFCHAPAFPGTGSTATVKLFYNLYNGHGQPPPEAAPPSDAELERDPCPQPEPERERVMLIVGFGSSHVAMAPQIEHFASDPRYTVLVMDNRGTGRSSAPIGRYRTTDLARDALALLDHVGWTDRVHILGSSMGGMVAQECVLLEPGRFASLTLLCTHRGGLTALPPLLLLLPPLITSGLAGLAGVDAKQRLKAYLHLLYPKRFLYERVADPAEPSRVLPRYEMLVRERMSRAEPAPKIVGLLAQLGAVTTHYVEPERLRLIAKAGIPTLIVSGRRDRVVRFENSLQLKKLIPSADLVTVDSAGHGIAHQHKDAVNAFVANHIARARL